MRATTLPLSVDSLPRNEDWLDWQHHGDDPMYACWQAGWHCREAPWRALAGEWQNQCAL